MNHISLEELREKVARGDRFILVNALEEHRFNSMHIPGSINLYKKEEILKYLRTDDEIVVYCTEEACNRSILLYQLLQAMGFQKVRRFAGGMKAWAEAGHVISKRMQWNIVDMYSTAVRKAQ